MIRLIRADLARMWKTKSFWICGIISTGLVLGNFFFSYAIKSNAAYYLGGFYLEGIMNIMFFTAIFVPLFIGADHSNGTIRNKMAVGHGRCSIYLSNFITCSIGGLLYCAASLAGLAVVGLFTRGAVGINAGRFALELTVSLLAVISACSMFTVIGMLASSKTSAAVVSLVGVIVMIIGMLLLLDLLARPKSDYLYIASPLRDVLKVFCSVLPYGQAAQLNSIADFYEPKKMPLYSIAFSAGMSAIGILIFRRKDLK